MRGINYFAGIGTAMMFAGFYCQKAALQKQKKYNKESELFQVSQSKKAKLILLMSGCILLITGVAIILNELKLIGL